MKPFFGIKVLVAGLMLSPFVIVVIYFLIKPLPAEIPPDDILFESAVELHEGGLLYLAISEYDKAIEINIYNLQAHQNAPMPTLQRATWAMPWWITTKPSA